MYKRQAEHDDPLRLRIVRAVPGGDDPARRSGGQHKAETDEDQADARRPARKAGKAPAQCVHDAEGQHDPGRKEQQYAREAEAVDGEIEYEPQRQQRRRWDPEAPAHQNR